MTVLPIEEQTVLVTGATGGMGKYVAMRLAAGGATVIVHGRDPNKLSQAAEEIRSATGNGNVDTVLAELSHLVDVDRMADEVLAGHDQLHALVNNAGIGRGAPRSGREVSRDGIELRLAVNYLAGYHLTYRLLPRLRECAPARIVHVASAAQAPIDFDDPGLESAYHGPTAYQRSKLAQIMFNHDLAVELAGSGVTSNVLHPATRMATNMVRVAGVEPLTTVEEGGDATVRLVTDPDLDGVTGRYFDGTHQAEPHPQCADPVARARLRHMSDGLLRHALGAGRGSVSTP
jgi:NAD(P)-dependent dehydrogenase (short-subunit alcohol dehydrogenase family)